MATVTPYLDKRYAAKDDFPVKIRILDGNKQRAIGRLKGAAFQIPA